MCTVSNKLQLCTCKTNAQGDKHFWVLYRYVKGKNEMIVGLPVMPVSIAPAINKINLTTLLQLLNEGNVFDEPLFPVNKDRVLLSFSMPDGDTLKYGFVYSKNKWVAKAYDFFSWFEQHDEIKEGKIKNAFK